MQDSRFSSGFYSEDPLYAHFKVDQYYEAIVVKIDKTARLIYVSLGGVIGIIPYEHFNWARERVITETREYFGLVSNPSSVVSLGDVVTVKIIKKTASLLDHSNASAKSEYLKLKILNELKKQKYLLCSLDQDPEVQGSLLALNPHNGEVISFVGGHDFSKSQFNRVVQAQRQPGSAFKPLLYAVALEEGFTPSSIIIDSPEALAGVDDMLNWKPRNYDGKFLGPITFRESLEKSRNVTTIKIADKLGVSQILKFTNRICFEAQLAEDLSLALGTFGVNLMELVSAYAIFPNGGKIVDSRSVISITDRDGNSYLLNENLKRKRIVEAQQDSLREFSDIHLNAGQEKSKAATDLNNDPLSLDHEKSIKVNPYHVLVGGEQVYDPRLSFVMTNLLKGVVLHGTGASAKSVSRFLGGKTGTTNNYIDAWFIGFSSNIAAGVWTGFDNNKTIGWGETGAKAALPIWREYMRAALQKYGEYDFTAPSDVVFTRIDKKTGKPTDASNPNAFMEAFVSGMIPDQSSSNDSHWNEAETSIGNDQILFEDDYFSQQ